MSTCHWSLWTPTTLFETRDTGNCEAPCHLLEGASPAMALFSKVSEQYTELVNFIIRPPRDDSYTEADLGPPTFPLGRKTYKRTDVVLINRRNQRLQCSHFEPATKYRSQEKLPCVVYLHGNCSSRVEALGTLPVLLPQGITVFAFDFAGSGKSDGLYVSLGWWEREDLDVVIEHLRASGTVSTIGLWGRSMGAVTALLHADRDPSIGGMILDSPFSSLRRLAEELASVVVAWRLPRFVLNSLLGMVRTTIVNKASFDINNLAPIDHVGHTFIPALFVVAKEDNFILPAHGEELFAKYAGDRNIVHVAGDHNSVRPRFLNDSAAIFFHTCLTLQALRASGSASVLKTPGTLEDVVGRGRREDSTGGGRRELSEGGNGSERGVSGHFLSGAEPDVSSSRHRNRSSPQMRTQENKLEFGEVPLIPGRTSSQESISRFSFPSVRLRSSDKKESSRASRTSEVADQRGSTTNRDGVRSSSPSHQHQLLYGGVQLPRRSSLLVKSRSLWRRQSSDSSENPSEKNSRGAGRREGGRERPHESATTVCASSSRSEGGKNKPDDSDPALLLESSCRKGGGDGRRFANGLRMIKKCSFGRSGSREEEADGLVERRRCGKEGSGGDCTFPSGPAKTPEPDAGWPAEGGGESTKRATGSSASDGGCEGGEDGEGLAGGERGGGGGFGFLANTHELNDMRRPEAAWRFLADDDGMVQLLASEGFSDDEDEIVQRAVALSLEEYLAARQNSLQEGGARGSASSLVSDDLPARFDSVAHHTSGLPSAHPAGGQPETAVAQGKAPWYHSGTGHGSDDGPSGRRSHDCPGSGARGDPPCSTDHHEEDVPEKRLSKSDSGGFFFLSGPSIFTPMSMSRSKGSAPDCRAGGPSQTEPDSQVGSPSTSSSSRLPGEKETSHWDVIRRNSRREVAPLAASPTSSCSVSSPLEGGTAVSSPVSQNSRGGGGPATTTRQRSLARASFSIPSFGLSFAKRRPGDQEDQAGK